MLLAFQGGLLNSGGFLACRRFVSHVTGFATLFGVEVAESSYSQAVGMLLVPLFFLVGSMLSGQLVDLRLKLRKKPKYYIVFGVLFILQLCVVVGGSNGLFGSFGEATASAGDFTVLALLCLICGIQNGTITTVSKSVVRTTHLTGVTTDLGIGLVRVLNSKKLQWKVEEDVKANFMRLGIIFFFGLGSLTGAIIFLQIGYKGFLLPAAISGFLFGAALYFQVLRSYRNPEIKSHGI